MDNRDLICENLSVSDDGVLCFAGQRTDSLAREYGTPLYLMDEDRIRHNIRTYVTGMEKALGKKKVAELLPDLIDKTAGAPTIAPASDKRPAYNRADDFEKLN